jgi:uncharacterized membrane protein
MAFCSACGTQIPEGSTMCPACSAKASAGGAAQSTTGGMTDNVAGALAYLLIPAIVFLVLEPYNKNRFIRFHSFQSIFVAVGLLILNFLLVWSFLGWSIYSIVQLGEFILWVVLLVKAYQGQMYKLPVIGDMAEKQANAV